MSFSKIHASSSDNCPVSVAWAPHSCKGTLHPVASPLGTGMLLRPCQYTSSPHNSGS